MGFLNFLKPREHEWTSSTLTAPLYPLEGYQAERDALLPGDARLKHHWAALRVSATPSGKHKGKPMVTVSVAGKVVGVIRYTERERAGEAWDAITRAKANIGTVRLAANEGHEGGTVAELTLGPHKYQPKR